MRGSSPEGYEKGCLMVSDTLLEALAEVMDKIERGEKTPDIVSALDSDFSIPPTEGRKLVMFAYGLSQKIAATAERANQLAWKRCEQPWR